MRPPRRPVPAHADTAAMMTGTPGADRAKLIQRGSLEGLGQDVAQYVPTAARTR